MKEQITKFDLEAAFKELNELEIPKVDGIKANKENLQETLKRVDKTSLLLEDYYNVQNKEELENAKEEREDEIAKAKLARIEKIVDLDAESPEDLLPSYVGKTIIQCPQCMTLFYKDKEDLIEDENDPEVVNVNEPCQHCGNVSGYQLIGKVAETTEDELDKFEREEEIPEEENELDLNFDIEEESEENKEENSEENKEEIELEEIPEDSEEEDKSEDEEEKEENSDEEKDKKKEESLNKESLKEEDLVYSEDAIDKMLDSKEFKTPISDEEVEEIINSDKIEEQNNEEKIDELEEALTESNEEIKDEYKKFIDHLIFDLEINLHPEDDFEDYINAETGDSTFTKEEASELNKKMEYFYNKLTNDEIYEPIFAAFKKLGIMDDELDFEELDESSINQHLTDYFTEVYSNVKNFEVTNCSLIKNKLMVEGMINFNSGKSKSTLFEFNLVSNKDNKVLFEGINNDIEKEAKFKLSCQLKNLKELFTESFEYSYKINDTLVEGLK